MTGVELIAAERERQVVHEGFTAYSDDRYNIELVEAAVCYARARGVRSVPLEWPWDVSWWKPSADPVRNLVRAGALIAAEVDRLQRAEG